MLDRIDYIALDGGNERGAAEEETFSNLANVLLLQEFELISVNFKSSRALFRRL